MDSIVEHVVSLQQKFGRVWGENKMAEVFTEATLENLDILLDHFSTEASEPPNYLEPPLLYPKDEVDLTIQVTDYCLISLVADSTCCSTHE